MKDNPCFKCESRAIGCHARCSKYIQAKEHHEIARRNYEEYKENIACQKVSIERVKRTRQSNRNCVYKSKKK